MKHYFYSLNHIQYREIFYPLQMAKIKKISFVVFKCTFGAAPSWEPCDQESLERLILSLLCTKSK